MQMRASKIKTRKEIRRYKRRLSIRIFLFLFILGFSFWFISRERFRIHNISIEGNRSLETSVLREKINDFLSHKILFFIPRNSIFTLSTKSLKDHIENSFPKIYDTKVSLKKDKTLFVFIEERKPHSLWCVKEENNRDDASIQDKEDQATDENSYFFTPNEQCYFADQKGYLYGEAPYFSDGVFKKIYLPKSLLQIGNQIFDRKSFDNFFQFIDDLHKKYAMNIDRIFIDENNEVKLFIASLDKTFFKEEPYLIYKKDEDYEHILKYIALLKKQKFFRKDFAQRPQDLVFIDLRIKNQIRYKFKVIEEKKKE